MSVSESAISRGGMLLRVVSLTGPPTREVGLRVIHGHERAQSDRFGRSEEHTSELQSQSNLVCRLLLENQKALLRLLCRQSCTRLSPFLRVPSFALACWSIRIVDSSSASLPCCLL